MIHFNHDELMLMSLYNNETRTALVDALKEMSEHISPEETELKALTESVLAKLHAMGDNAFSELNLLPDFHPKDCNSFKMESQLKKTRLIDIII